METSENDRRPSVLVFAGLDPSGGAGIQADIGAIAAMGAHAAPVVTASTVQDTVDVRACRPADPAHVVEQAEVVLADLDVRAIKIGLLGDPDVLDAVAEICRRNRGLPVVLDPVLAAGGGRTLCRRETRRRLLDELLPLSALLTPNGPEARTLGGAASTQEAVRVIIERGCPHVLVTGGHDDTDGIVVDRLHGREGLMGTWRSPRLGGAFHGTGCTLASAIAAGLALGVPLTTAVGSAIGLVQRALANAYRVGRGQLVLAPGGAIHPPLGGLAH